MEGAIAVIYIAVIIVIFMRVYTNSKKRQGRSQSDTKTVKMPAPESRRPDEAGSDKRPAAHRSAESDKSAVNRLMDDREHDWLARQLREERIAKSRMSDMFELKREHADNCEAHEIKSAHMDNCDAEGTVDTAAGR